MPHATYAYAVMRLECPEDPARLPVPEEHPSIGIAAHDEFAVRAETHLACVPAVCVALEDLLWILLEALARTVHNNLIVEALARDPAAVRVHRDARHGVHRWVGDILDLHGRAKVPYAQTLIIAARHEASVFVDKGDGVHRSEMLVVFLLEVPGVHIELHDFLIAHAGEHHILLIVIWVESHAVGYFARREAPDDFARFRVPEFDHAIEAGTEEARAVVAKLYIFHCLCVSEIGAHTFAGAIDVPNL